MTEYIRVEWAPQENGWGLLSVPLYNPDDANDRAREVVPRPTFTVTRISISEYIADKILMLRRELEQELGTQLPLDQVFDYMVQGLFAKWLEAGGD